MFGDPHFGILLVVVGIIILVDIVVVVDIVGAIMDATTLCCCSF